jgi:hypothetical protein
VFLLLASTEVFLLLAPAGSSESVAAAGATRTKVSLKPVKPALPVLFLLFGENGGDIFIHLYERLVDLRAGIRAYFVELFHVLAHDWFHFLRLLVRKAKVALQKWNYSQTFKFRTARRLHQLVRYQD